MNKTYVVGIGFRPLGQKAADVVRTSDAVLTNDRLLKVFKSYREYETVQERIIIHDSVYETVDYIIENYREKKISLLAAGDPMFFGIGRLIVEKLGQDAVEVYPDLSSIQVAFSRVKETSNNALLLSLHGGPDPEKRRRLEHDIAELPELLAKHGTVAILTDRVNSPEKIAETLLKRSEVRGQRSALKMYVCEKLGYPEERIVEGTPGEIVKGPFEHPNVVIVKRSEDRKIGSTDAGARSPRPYIFSFGLRESEIEHAKGLITKDEVRAVTIHKLRLPRTGVFWDVGAGSGSVSLEAARLFPDLKVFAVEKRLEQIHIIDENINNFGVSNVNTVQGNAPDALRDLPAPQRVFVGGSGGGMSDIVQCAAGAMNTGIIVANATTIETLNEAIQCFEKNGYHVDVAEVSVSRSKMVGGKRHMSALNPIFIVAGEII